MKNLRNLIRRLILEVYELSPEDEKKLGSMDKFDQLSPNLRRALGLQSKEEIVYDRSVLQDYQTKLRQHPSGRKMIKDFQTGAVSICHTSFYEGAAVDVGFKDESEEIIGNNVFTNWLRKYGSKSKDTISCVAFNKKVGERPSGYFGQNVEGFENSVGFYMKGYPTYVSKYDVMSQTLGALPSGLIKHQKHSGIAKRAGTRGRTGAIYGEDWQWAGEVLLDNWQPIGIYIDVANAELDYQEWYIRDLMEDALKTGLPLYMFDGSDTSYGRVDNIDSFISDHGGLY